MEAAARICGKYWNGSLTFEVLGIPYSVNGSGDIITDNPLYSRAGDSYSFAHR